MNDSVETGILRDDDHFLGAVSVKLVAQIGDQLKVQAVAAFVTFQKFRLAGGVHQLNRLRVGHAWRMLGVKDKNSAGSGIQRVQKLNP